MAAKKGGLGRGYQSLFIDNSSDINADSGITTLPIGEIEPDREQPRKDFDEEKLNDLASSIAEHGVLQPILVRPHSNGGYKIVAGERRYRAARIADLREIPVIIKSFSDEEAAAIALIENLQREDLNPIEEARGIDKLIKEYNLSQEQAAERLSKSRPAITNSLRLLSLPEEVLSMVEDGSLSAGHARSLLSLKNGDDMLALAEKCIAENLSVRRVEELVKKQNSEKKSVTADKKKDKFYEEATLALKNNLGREVSIKTARKGGSLIIEFFDKEDLQKLIKMFDE